MALPRGLSAQENMKQRVAIVFDGSDRSLRGASQNMYNMFRSNGIDSVLVRVTSHAELRGFLSDTGSYIIVYVLHGGKDGVMDLSWFEFSRYLAASNAKHHIILSCYSSEITRYFTNGTGGHYIYVVEGEIDARVAEIEGGVRVASILMRSPNPKTRRNARTLFDEIVNHTINTFPEILVRLLIPIDPLLKFPEKSGFSGPAGFIADMILSLTRQYLQAQGYLDDEGNLVFTVDPILVDEELSLDFGGGEFPINISIAYSMSINSNGLFSMEASVCVSKEQKGHLGKILNVIGTKITGEGIFEFNGFITDQPIPHIEFKDFTFKISFEIEKSLDVKEIIRSIAPEGVARVIDRIQEYVGLEISASIKFGGSLQIYYDFTKDTTELTVSIWFGSELKVEIAIVTFSAGITIRLDFRFTPGGNYFTATFTAYAAAEVDLVFATLEFKGEFELKWTAGPEDSEGTQMNIDTDNDGLSDDFENSIGTDPNNPDTDGDGIPDGIEIYEYKTDPNDPDTDNDNIDDGAERDWYESHYCDPLGDPDNDEIVNILDDDSDNDGVMDGDEILIYGSDPLIVDSDGDGLPDGVEVSIGSSPVCSNSDHDMIGDLEEYMLGLNLTNNDTDGDGLPDGAEEYILLTDPANNDTDGDGVPDGEEIRHSANPLLNDTDSDNISDYDEIYVYHTYPNSSDSDMDNVSDYYEIFGWDIFVNDNISGPVRRTVYSDPLKNDTDDDGVCDGMEKLYGSDPNISDTDHDGLTDKEEIFGIYINSTTTYYILTQQTMIRMMIPCQTVMR